MSAKMPTDAHWRHWCIGIRYSVPNGQCVFARFANRGIACSLSFVTSTALTRSYSQEDYTSYHLRTPDVNHGNCVQFQYTTRLLVIRMAVTVLTSRAKMS